MTNLGPFLKFTRRILNDLSDGPDNKDFPDVGMLLATMLTTPGCGLILCGYSHGPFDIKLSISSDVLSVYFPFSMPYRTACWDGRCSVQIASNGLWQYKTATIPLATYRIKLFFRTRDL